MSTYPQPLAFDIPAVLHIERPSTWEFDHMKQEQRPFLMKGCLDEWPLYQELHALSSVGEKTAYLRKHDTNKRISFVALPAEHGGHLYFANGLKTNGKRLKRNASFGEFTEMVATATTKPLTIAYMHSTSVAELPGLGAKVELLPYVQRSLIIGFNFWIGSGGHVVDLHYDLDYNFVCMVDGVKRVILAPPEVMHDVYPRALDRAPYGATATSARLLAPDFTTFPRLRKAAEKFCVAVLKPGEVLYIPPYWWHHVESFGLNVMVNMWQLTIAPGAFTPVSVLRRRSLEAFAGQPEEIRTAYRARYSRDVFRLRTTAMGGDASSSEGRLSLPSLESLFGQTRTAMSNIPEFIRSGEAVFYDQWVFRSLGDPIENQPGEFERMIRRIRRDRRKSTLRRFFFRW